MRDRVSYYSVRYSSGVPQEILIYFQLYLCYIGYLPSQILYVYVIISQFSAIFIFQYKQYLWSRLTHHLVAVIKLLGSVELKKLIIENINLINLQILQQYMAIVASKYFYLGIFVSNYLFLILRG